MLKRRVTQKEVAIAAGVHRATVSLVFRNHPSIPEKTKTLVRRAAEKIGYAPDPMLAALAVYRGSNRPRAFQGSLAWLTNSLGSYRWRDYTQFVEYHEGASSRARDYGFNLEVFDFQTKGLKPERLATILHSRNIRGLLLCPQPLPHMQVDFPWDEFSAVTFGYTLENPRLHTVSTTHFQTMVTVMEKLHAFGYRRIALGIASEHDERTGRNYLAGYLLEQHRIGEKPLIPPWEEMERHPEKIKNWVRQHRPDSLVTGNRHIIELLRKSGLQAPRDLGVAGLALDSTKEVVSGVYENSFRVGEVAVDFLVSMIQRGELGMTREQQYILVEGNWVEGATLQDQKSRKVVSTRK